MCVNDIYTVEIDILLFKFLISYNVIKIIKLACDFP